MRHALTWLIGMASVLAGCTMRPPRSAAGATLGQLYQRAQIDLGCAMPYLRDFPLDGRTRLVQGCGRQLIYVESCDPIRGAFQCTWLADSPAVAVSPAPSSQAPASTAVASQPCAPATDPGRGQGKINVASSGGYCEVIVDGRKRGVTPVAGIVVAAGVTEISCQTPDETVRREVHVAVGETARVLFELDAPGPYVDWGF